MATDNQRSRIASRLPPGRPIYIYCGQNFQICVRQEGSEDEVESLETSEDGWRDDESELFIQLISCDHVLFVCVLFTYLDT